MKKIWHIAIILAFLLALIPVGVSADPVSEPLFAGQDMQVGSINVSNDGTNLTVEYVITDPDWCIMSTHLHVADSLDGIPQTKKGNPIPGQFDYNDAHDCVPSFTYTIPLAWSAGEVLFIAAHAVVGSPVEGCYETAWQIGDVETLGCADGTLLTNYADEFNWVEEDGNGGWQPLSDACAAGPGLAVYEPPFSSTFVVGTTPESEFPYNANVARGYGTDINVTWDGALPFGGYLLLSWSPGKSATETKLVTSGDGLHAEFTASGTPQAGYGWFLNTYPLVENIVPVDPLSAGTHSINFKHTQGDGTFWDWIRLKKPCEQWETAWGGTVDFPGKNWATYLTYEVQKVFLETLEVPATSFTDVCSSSSLASGDLYELVASGTYAYRQDGFSIADAEWAQRPVGDLYNPGSEPIWIKGDGTYSRDDGLDIAVNGENVDWGALDLEDHTYSLEVPGTDSTFCFSIWDSYYGDNSGSLTVDIYLLP